MKDEKKHSSSSFIPHPSSLILRDESLIPISVVGLGSILVDRAVVLDRFPQVDTKTEVRESWTQVGGPVPTALVQIARFGKRVHFVGKWGSDSLGQLIEADLQHEGVEFASSVCEPEGQTGFAQVWVDGSTGTRTIAFQRGKFAPLCEGDARGIDLEGVRALHLDGWSGEAALFLAKSMREMGGTTFLDAGSPKPGLEELWPFVDVVFCSTQFVRRYLGNVTTEEAGATLLEKGPKIAVVTEGKGGATLFSTEGHVHQPAFDVAVSDTTGAGDVFCGAFVFACVSGQSPEAALRFASAAAALKCTKRGNREALPSLEEVNQLL